MRILVAEDEHTTALLLTRILERGGHSVVRATDGISAFEELRSYGPFDAVVTDWMMPRLDGIGFIRKARSELMNLPPIIVVTAIASDDARDLVLDAGADDYLAKPVAPEALLQCVVTCVARHVQPSLAQPVGAPDAVSSEVRLAIPLIGIVGGAGGPAILQKLVSRCVHAAQASFVVVQHGPHWMLEAFALRLQAQSTLRVSLAKDGAKLDRGTLWVAPGGRHVRLTVDGERLELCDLPEENYVRPAGDVLFRSMVKRARSCAAVVLTGLGCDGAVGAQSLGFAGGKVFIQHPASADVAGMPKAAQYACVGSTLLPPSDIPNALDDFVLEAQRTFA